jgi:hypothetical protein
MKVFAVQLLNHCFRVWIVRVPLELSGGSPPKPILDDVVDGDFQVAVFLGDAKDFGLGSVFIFALPEAVGPFAEERGVASEGAVVGDELVKGWAVAKVIIN